MNKLLYGVAYYYEYLPYDRLEEDIKAKHTTFDAVRTHNFAYVFKHISEKTGCSATARIE